MLRNDHRAAIAMMAAFFLAVGCAQTRELETPAPLAPDLAGADGPGLPDAANPDPARAVLFSYPVVDGVLYSPYGASRGGGSRRHSGADISAPHGTPVYAAGAGRVVHAGFGYQGSAAWGRVVLLDHGQGWTTLYAHLSRVDVTIGETLLGGELIGRIGETGNATGPHLHVEVRQNGESRDPVHVIPGIGAGS